MGTMRRGSRLALAAMGAAAAVVLGRAPAAHTPTRSGHTPPGGRRTDDSRPEDRPRHSEGDRPDGGS